VAEAKDALRKRRKPLTSGRVVAELAGVVFPGEMEEEGGEIVGLPNAAKLLEDLPNKIRDVLGILVEVNLRQENGAEFLEIKIEPYPNPISYRGHYFTRSGSTMQELKGAALDRFLLGRQGRTWDGVPMPGVKTADLSPAAVRRFRALAANSGRLEAADLAASDAGLIEKLKLTEGGYLKRAVVLLFHEDPEKFVTGAFVKIGFFRSETDLAYHDALHGNLFSQVAKTIDLVRTKYLKAAITYQGIQRIERYPVPNAALREAILNALVHRDYAVGAPVQIRVYEDKLKI
jgi:ATP-dependent DNA helicase RecG